MVLFSHERSMQSIFAKVFISTVHTRDCFHDTLINTVKYQPVIGMQKKFSVLLYQLGINFHAEIYFYSVSSIINIIDCCM